MENTTKKPAGLLVAVYRSNDGDCSNNGVSARFDSFVLVGKGIPEVFEASERVPALYLRARRMSKTFMATPDGEYNSFGGAFAFSSDSRFSEITGGAPIPIHDRVEY